MQVVPGHPGVVVVGHVLGVKCRPHLCAAGHSPHITIHQVIGILHGILTQLQFGQHVVQPCLQTGFEGLIPGSCICHAQRRQVVTTYMAIQSITYLTRPVDKGFARLSNASLFLIRLQQPVHVISQQNGIVQQHGLFEGTIQ